MVFALRFAWGLCESAGWFFPSAYSAPAFRDNEKLAANADAYWQACPDSLGAYSYAARIENVEFNARAAARLRKLLEGRTGSEALWLYNTLWSMEFKAVPLSEQEPVRQRVRKDAEFLRSQDLAKHGFLLNTLSQAYKLAGDAEGAKWVEAEQAKNGRSTMPGASAASQAINEWRKANPYKSGSERDAYQERLLKQAVEWIHQWPDDPQPRCERFQVLQTMRDAPLEDTVGAAADWIRVYEQHPAFIDLYLNVAEFYSRHNMRYAELPDLLEKALKKSPPMRPAAPASDLYPSQPNRSAQFGAWSTLTSVARIYLKLKKYDRARELLAQVGPPLLKAKPSDSASDMEKRQYGSAEYAYWSDMATLARADGNKLDLLNYERPSLLANPFSNPASEEYQIRSLRIHRAGDATWGHTVILARARSHLDSVLQALKDLSVPTVLAQRRDQFLAPHFQWLQFCLRQVVRPHDKGNFTLLVNAHNKMADIKCSPTDIMLEAEQTDADYLIVWASTLTNQGAIELRKTGEYAIARRQQPEQHAAFTQYFESTFRSRHKPVRVVTSCKACPAKQQGRIQTCARRHPVEVFCAPAIRLKIGRRPQAAP